MAIRLKPIPNAKRFLAQAKIPPGLQGNNRFKRDKVNIQDCPCCSKPMVNAQVYDGESGGKYVICDDTGDVVYINID